MRKNSGKKQQPDPIDEVEELLKQTQEDLLLKLTINSHIKSKSKSKPKPESSHSNAIDPDLDRRFEALRSKPIPHTSTGTDGKDLFARFAALKGGPAQETVKIQEDGDDEDEEDEVEKIINWAIDAARLDPSPESDLEDEGEEDDEEEEDDSDDSDEDRKKKGSKK